MVGLCCHGDWAVLSHQSYGKRWVGCLNSCAGAMQSPLSSPEGFPRLEAGTEPTAALVQHHAVAGQLQSKTTLDLHGATSHPLHQVRRCRLRRSIYRQKIAKLSSRFSEQQKEPLSGPGTLLACLAGTAVGFRFLFYGYKGDGKRC